VKYSCGENVLQKWIGGKHSVKRKGWEAQWRNKLGFEGIYFCVGNYTCIGTD
jgi:hypothetical protein